MRIAFILVLVLLCSVNCFATQKIFYDTTTGNEITDVSGKLTIDQVAERCKIDKSRLVETTVDETKEDAVLIDGKIVKYNYIEEAKKDLQNKEKIKGDKKKALKDKFNFTEQDIENLREVLR